LSITSIAGACSDPERFVGIHFFNPATLMPLVEVIPGVQTSSEVLAVAYASIASWGKSAVIAKDTPGFIVNRVARPFYGESIRIFEERWMDLPEGTAGMATIDWALKEHGGFRMGPFELMDLIGNDINYTVTETVWKQFYHDPRYRPSLTQRRMVEAGRLGRKSGKGYYDYSENAAQSAPDKDPVRAAGIVRRVLAMLINEAADACHLQVASAKDIDIAMTKGVNYPKGLLQWCDELGAADVLRELETLREWYAEDRYRPSVLLKKMANEGLHFHS
jgi:3-hydroxybutyryl-CoA dehydrogenase